MPTAAWNTAQRVLAIRLDALGDLLMTTPALAALKTACSERTITLLTSSSGAAAVPLLPMVDGAIVSDVPWMKASPLENNSQSQWRLIDRLRSEQFDAAVIFTVFSQSPLPAALVAYLADIPLRLAHARENPYRLLTDWIPEPEPERSIRHEVQRQLDLVAAVGAQVNDPGLQVQVPPAAAASIQALLWEHGVDPAAGLIVVHPGASAPSRRYPPGHFAAAAKQVYRETGLPLIFTGTAAEEPLAGSIIDEAGIPAVSLAGQTSLAELAALLQSASLLISNNTGPVHLAAAVGTPVVDLYALTNPQHAPWRVPHELLYHDVACRNCFKSVCPEGHQHCLSLVSPAAVAAAALRLVGRHSQEAQGVYARN